MPSATPRRPSGPISDLPLRRMGELAEEIARAWLVALIESRPLSRAGEVPVDAVAAEGTALCEAVVRAVASDHDLARLEPGGDLEPLGATVGALAGALDAGEAVMAVESLRAAATATLLDPEWGITADAVAASERLSTVAARLAAAAALAFARAGAAPMPQATDPPLGAPPSSHGPVGPERRDPAPPVPPAAAPIDLDAHRARLSEASAAEAAERETGQPLWLVALERQIAAGGRFALLLMDIDGADKLRASTGEAVLSRVARAARDQIRRSDLIAHEPDGRTWVVSPEAGRLGATALADRLADAVASVEAPRGTPLTASIGIVHFPEDGRDADTLMDAAEEAMFAARAAGVPVAADDEPPDEEEPDPHAWDDGPPARHA